MAQSRLSMRKIRDYSAAIWMRTVLTLIAARHVTLLRLSAAGLSKRQIAARTSPEKVEGFSDRFCESEEQEWASQRRTRGA